jgi:uncharacterized protein (TIGR02996 family)
VGIGQERVTGGANKQLQRTSPRHGLTEFNGERRGDAAELMRSVFQGVMRDEKGFVFAIATAPTDDMHRLVYADWLEERGDPRAAYLRLATRAAGRVRDGLPLGDLPTVLRDTYAAAPAEWRGQVGPWFDVVLEGVHKDCKIGVVKVIYNLVCRNLLKAVELVDFLPSVVRARLLLDEAEELREQLERGYGISPWPPEHGPACRVALRISSHDRRTRRCT